MLTLAALSREDEDKGKLILCSFALVFLCFKKAIKKDIDLQTLQIAHYCLLLDEG